MLGRRKDVSVRLSAEDRKLLQHIAAELEHICSALNGEPEDKQEVSEDDHGE
ncbi:hypothetical protein LCGC14_0932580 [marine sediment metagenome]|uniref:Uncharacterized protein n=1 Tax=marine sediment metagenome TaxID=412755 RepID=A0A0F9RU16_9ZZZZ